MMALISLIIQIIPKLRLMRMRSIIINFIRIFIYFILNVTFIIIIFFKKILILCFYTHIAHLLYFIRFIYKNEGMRFFKLDF
jgi:hypothetical protein